MKQNDKKSLKKNDNKARCSKLSQAEHHKT